MITTPLEMHPERNVIRLELRQNIVLKEMTDAERDELEPHLLIVDGGKGRSTTWCWPVWGGSMQPTGMPPSYHMR